MKRRRGGRPLAHWPQRCRPRPASQLPTDAWLFAVVALLATSCTYVPDRKVKDTGLGTAVSPALEKDPEHFLKRKVAIARFSNETQYGRSVLLDDVDAAGDVIGKRAADILATRLGETEKFLLFERMDGEKLARELEKGKLESQEVPVDYLILGSITEFGRETTGETGFLTRTKTQKAHARVVVRLVDVRTSRVIFSEEGSGEAVTQVGTVAGIGTKAGYDSTLNDKAISAAISKLISNLVENLLEEPWRSNVVLVEEDAIYIAGGESQGLGQGDRLAVYQRGRRVANPQTGIELELPGKKVATIEVESLFGNDALQEGARCKIVDGSLRQVPLDELVVKEE